jgi:hypothetical protein
LLGVIQMLWDRAEPAGYLHAISREPLPGNKPHQVREYTSHDHTLSLAPYKS